MGKFYGNKSKQINIKCSFCNKEFNRNYSRVNEDFNFCSNICRGKFKSKQTEEKIIKGEYSDIRIIRKYLLTIREHSCEICKNKKWNDVDIPLVLDHIDGNPYNNTILNLRFLCPNCDALTSTYKWKNRGNGRYERRKRFKENKSY